MRSQFFKGLGVYALRALYAASLFLVSIYVGSAWGAEALGVFSITLTVCTAGIAFASFGGHYRIVGYIVSATGRSRSKLAYGLCAQTFWAGLAVGLFCWLVLRWTIGSSPVIVGALALGAFAVVCSGTLVALQKQVSAAVIDCVAKPIGLVGAVAIAAALGASDVRGQVDYWFLTMFAAPAFLGLAFLWHLFGRPKASWFLGLAPFGGGAIILAVFGVVEVLVSQIDRLILSQLMSTADAGLYSAAQSFLNVVLYGVVACTALVLPGLVGLTDGHDSARRLRVVVTRTLAIAAGVAATSCIFLGDLFLSIYGDDFRVAKPALVVLMLGLFVSLLFGFPVAALLVNRFRLEGLLLSVAALIVTIVGCFVLIPKFGLVGAALANVVGMLGLKVSAWATAKARFGQDLSVFGRAC